MEITRHMRGVLVKHHRLSEKLKLSDKKKFKWTQSERKKNTERERERERDRNSTRYDPTKPLSLYLSLRSYLRFNIILVLFVPLSSIFSSFYYR